MSGQLYNCPSEKAVYLNPVITRINQCRICGNSHLEPLCNLGTMSFTGIFPSSLQEVVPEGPLELVKCHSDQKHCGLVQLRHSFDRKLLFGESYGYRSSLNNSMKHHLEALVKDMDHYVHFRMDDVVIDVGSNDGTLLNSLSGRGLTLIGIDPLAEKFKTFYHRDVTLVKEFFSAGMIKDLLGPRKAKVVTAVAVFYDFNEPLMFFKDIASILSNDGVFLLEQSYLPFMLSNNAYDTICHEHAGYYGLRQIQWLAEHSGLKIIDVSLNKINGGSIRIVLAKEDSSLPHLEAKLKGLLNAEEEQGLDKIEPYDSFTQRIFRHRLDLKAVIGGLRKLDKTIAGYGASTKGNVILQFTELTAKEIPFIAEINEDKWGRYCPGSKIPILPENEVRSQKPDVFLILPWHFKDSLVQKEVEYLKNGGSFVVPFPVISSLDINSYFQSGNK